MPRPFSAPFARRLSSHLKRGGLVAYPTESCYGLGCLPQNVRALQKLVRLKKRPQHKGMIVIGDGLPRLLPLLKGLSEKEQHSIAAAWPAPLTYLLPVSSKAPVMLRGKGRSKLAVRVPAHQGARALCRALRTPLVSTSCNKAGKRPCKTEREVRRQFGRQVAIIGGRCGGAKTPSRIVDWESGKRLR
ncbi:L-threonylcarbamoyladenylate synthase [Neisseria wadsworthii]|uniref:Threonylcarbamoyl-AMP synthase n=1 Tax=Neisseria wadsworthii 9715 TaxID=1030841 RepID=G4CM36_9NEIS|nr:L-threonylcarbamoyladenylate synthase [Neisseria wadsworthii]EGZ51235.1 translation factor RimN [Neisseria wadsworthii 9715]QMT36205.1 L-threonylcarbamoyladenylate synthase [Neisseria wadsworthii]